jgi:hypothetical protein
MVVLCSEGLVDSEGIMNEPPHPEGTCLHVHSGTLEIYGKIGSQPKVPPVADLTSVFGEAGVQPSELGVRDSSRSKPLEYRQGPFEHRLGAGQGQTEVTMVMKDWRR